MNCSETDAAGAGDGDGPTRPSNLIPDLCP